MPRKETLLRPATLAKLNESSMGVDMVPDDLLPPWVVPVKKVFYISRKQLRKWCRLPYPRHDRGCPNAYGTCLLIDGKRTAKTIDKKKPMWIVYNEFDLVDHMRGYHKNHPKATCAQQRNVLYWQPKSLTGLNKRVCQFVDMVQPSQYGELLCLGEGDGVNIWRTATHAGIHLEPIHKMKTCRHLALLCFRREQ